MDTRRQLGQYFTPRWVAEAIIERHFSDLAAGSTVIEPSCGNGAFLHAIPVDMNAIGVELDPSWAEQASLATGRPVLVGDFRTVELPQDVCAVVGNPPFQADTVAEFLDRAHGLLREDGKCGFILPAYIFQTSSKVLAMAERWSIEQELMPRNLFPGLSLPLVYSTFTKARQRRLIGFFLYREAAEVQSSSAEARATLATSTKAGSVWRQALHEAFDLVAEDRAPLDALYLALEGRRPTANPNFRQKLRQTLQRYPEFSSTERGVWRRQAAS